MEGNTLHNLQSIIHGHWGSVSQMGHVSQKHIQIKKSMSSIKWVESS